MSETEYNELARAVVRTYDPELSVQTLIAVALFAYDSSKWELPEAASEQTEFSDTKR